MPPLPWEVLAVESNQSASTGAETHSSYATPAGASAMKFAIAGGSGDADLYVRFGAAPTTSTYDCRPYLTGNNETCTFDPSSDGTYHVMIHAYAGYSGLTLTVSHAGGATVDPEVCDDALDNDEDGLTDCDDPDCAFDLACAEPEVCDDAVDNDLDGLTDCDDSDCALDLACAEPEVCDDGVDNDLDGLTDCADLADCEFDAACVPDEVCDDAVDNDLDGLTDCDDGDCAFDLACAEPEVCTDGIDNDLDGDTDCADADCGSDPACTSFCGDGTCGTGESCDGRNGTLSCSTDCDGRTNGRPSLRYCFVEGVCEGPGCP